MQIKQSKTLSLFWILIITGILGISLVAVQKIQDFRSKASNTKGVASIILSPATSTLTPGQTVTVQLTASILDRSVDGFQIVAQLQGQVPTNLTFTPNTPSGLQLVKNTFIFPLNVPSTKTLTLAYVTQDPTHPFSASGLVNLGSFQFTVPESGSMFIQFNPQSTKIVQTKTVEDILATPPGVTYTFASPSPIPQQPSVTPLIVKPGKRTIPPPKKDPSHVPIPVYPAK